jgi:hypothetical protein
MANIFAAITAVLLLASAFVAYKNQQAFEKEVADSEEQQRNLDTNRNTLSGLIKDRDDTHDERVGVEEDTLAQQKVEEERKSGNDGLQQQIGLKKQEVESNASKISDIEEQTKELGDIRDLAEKVQRLRTTIAGLEDDKAGMEAKLAGLLGQKSSTEGTIEGFRDIDDAFAKQRSYFTSASISGIFPTWGFVTISAGNSAGVVTNSTLDVVRDGEVVAKLKVRSVEASRASADIVPDSMAEDSALMVGDKVVPSAAVEAPVVPVVPAAGDAAEPPPPVPAEAPEEESLDFGF